MTADRGDSALGSFVAFYERTASLVYRRACRLLGDRQAAADAAQEVFLRVLAVFPDLDRDAPAVSWLYQVTTNHCLNVLRDGRRRAAILSAQIPAASSFGPDVPIDLLLRGVPAPLQEVAVYYFVDEMSQDEIASVLGVSQRTVSTRLKEFRAMAERLWKTPVFEVSP